MPKSQLDAFVEGLVAQPGLGFPLFTVSDCNSFHTSGYLWSLYAALKMLKSGLPSGAVAIINFDQHADRDEPKTGCIASDRWGASIVNTLKERNIPALYLSVFNGALGEAYAIAPGVAGASAGTLHTCIAGKDYAGFWREARARVDGLPFRYVFVTIDRDVMKDNFTQWGDGYYSGYKDLKTAMDTVLRPLFYPAATETTAAIAKGPAQEGESPTRNVIDVVRPLLIGFDVTGLPEKPATGGGKSPKSFDEKYSAVIEAPEAFLNQTYTSVWAALNAELATYLEFAWTWPLPEKARPGQLVLFTGSVSLGQVRGDDEGDCWDFMVHLAGRLGQLLSRDWNFLLSHQVPSVYKHGWKPMILYSGAKPVTGAPNREAVAALLGPGIDVGGFSCTASISKPGQVMPGSVLIADMENKTGPFAIRPPVKP